MEIIELKTKTIDEFIDLTDKVKELIKDSNISEGIVHIQSLHTTTSVVVIENEDPDLLADFFDFWNDTIKKGGWKHDKKCPRVNAHAHIKSAIMNPGVSVPFKDGELVLGRYQGICFVEFDGPQTRRVAITIK